MTGTRPRPSTLWARQELLHLDSLGRRRGLDPLDGPQGPWVSQGGRPFLNFSSNDYLGLSSDPRPAAAMAESAFKLGAGMGSARLVVGDSPAHRSLEGAFSKLLRTESALLFSSGYAANVGAMQALLGPEDVVFSDALNHASLIDGCRLSRARAVIYPHADPAALARLLNEHRGRRRLIATDAVFSMDGDLAPLAELAQLAEEQGAGLYVDEAHALGLYGERGAGLCEALDIEAAVDGRMVGFGKSLGTSGAIVAGGQEWIELLLNKARSFIFSTALPPPVCAAAQASLELIQSKPNLRHSLWRNIHLLSDGLLELGWPAAPRSPIFPVVLGKPERALAVSEALRERGILVKAIRPPTVPDGTSRLRISLSARHTPQDVEALLAALRETGIQR